MAGFPFSLWTYSPASPIGGGRGNCEWGMQHRGCCEHVTRATLAPSAGGPLWRVMEHASALSYLKGKEGKTCIHHFPLSFGERPHRALTPSLPCVWSGHTPQRSEEALRQSVADLCPQKLPTCREAVSLEGIWAGHP